MKKKRQGLPAVLMCERWRFMPMEYALKTVRLAEVLSEENVSSDDSKREFRIRTKSMSSFFRKTESQPSPIEKNFLLLKTSVASARAIMSSQHKKVI
jgi:hypothetical protein